MAQNFTTNISYEGDLLQAVILPNMRRNGMHYEVNISGFPRFWLHWGAMDRYEISRPAGVSVPDELVLAVSDAIEKRVG